MPRLLSAALLVASVVAVVAAQVPATETVGPSALARGQLPREPGSFTFCRLMYRSVRSETLGSGWRTDYPSADNNLMIRLAELTTVDISRGVLDEPLFAILRATDENLFRCPFLYASDVGTLSFLDPEVTALHDYFLKGGFLWVDDFWGEKALREFETEMARVLPKMRMVELTPDHPIFSTYFTLHEVPQIPAISYWLATNGSTSERGGASDPPNIHAIFDENDRLVVLMTHDTDIADGWEREGQNTDYFHMFSPWGYAVGVNVVIWSMTH